MTGNARPRNRTANAVPRCPRGHVIRPHREYLCPDCRQSCGPCRCRLFDHVTGAAGRVVNGTRHRIVYPILGGGFRVTYNAKAVERD